MLPTCKNNLRELCCTYQKISTLALSFFFSCECSLPPTCSIDGWLHSIQNIGFDHIIVSYAGNHTNKTDSRSSHIDEVPGTTLNDRSLCFVKHVYCGVDREEEPNWIRD